MSYLVLARKFRPQNFDEVIGQDHITTTLKNAITQNRVAHAYLFTGPRGIGKTSTARILAKALNCQKGPRPVPCDKCPSCEEIMKGSSLDVIEIDGASNRGIEEVRNLRENVKFAPSRGRFKVYIIDEVHMLTQEAFNALLKTLEEPPAHVKFVFATTAPYKVPATILSRCQRFDFKRIPIQAIVDKLKDISSQEKFIATEDALFAIAKASEGSMRDAESILDQLASFCDKKMKLPRRPMATTPRIAFWAPVIWPSRPWSCSKMRFRKSGTVIPPSVDYSFLKSYLSSPNIHGPQSHIFGSVKRGYVGLVRPGGRDHIHHFGYDVYIGHGHVAVLVGIGMIGIENHSWRRSLLVNIINFRPVTDPAFREWLDTRDEHMVGVGSKAEEIPLGRRHLVFHYRRRFLHYNFLPAVGTALRGAGCGHVGYITGDYIKTLPLDAQSRSADVHRGKQV